jgi:hypothetical protein
MVGTWQHGYEPSGSIKDGGLLERLSASKYELSQMEFDNLFWKSDTLLPRKEPINHSYPDYDVLEYIVLFRNGT